MHENQKLINEFYAAFQRKDFQTMQKAYASSANFTDPVFQNLNAEQTKAMWEMLCKRAQDLDVQFQNVQADEYNGSADWEATYTFSSTGRKVVNRIHAEFVFERGKIVQHVDDFNFHSWSKQAFGLTGLVIGWTPFFRAKVRSTVMKSLGRFMEKEEAKA
jgi:ketosteroid isomerase-like protein